MKLITSICMVGALGISTLLFAQKPSAAKANLDWQGTYSGIVPSASGGGMETELQLNSNNTYKLTTKHNKPQAKATTQVGKFSWNGNNIVLAGIAKGTQANIYKIEENRVRQLDLKGKEIKGNLSTQYILTKNGNMAVENKRWKLVELNGKAIIGTEKTHYIIFHSKDNKLEAKAGCNQLVHQYSIKNKIQLSIKQGISTMMACPDKEEIEKQFIEALTKADNLLVATNKLTINKARMAPLAVFELVP